MKKLKKKKAVFCIFAVLGMILFSGISILYSADQGQELLEKFKSYEPETPLIPGDVQVSTVFVLGKEKKVGQIQQVQGRAYVIHAGQKIAYLLKNDHPLLVGDTVITLSKSRLNAVMNDKSVLALAPQAKLIITKADYSPSMNTRTTIIDLIWGSARFIVKKISGKPDFTVKTKTAVCGVRGTDFAVSVAPVEKMQKTSSLNHFLAYLNPVREAHAFLPGALITTALTGPGSTVGLTGVIGGTTIVGPASVAGAVGGAAAGGGAFVGAAAAGGVLGSIGPGLATLSMPAGLN